MSTMTAMELGISILITSLSGLTIAQLSNVSDATKAGQQFSEMSATAILGTVAVLSVICTGYLVRFLMSKMMSALEETTKACQRVADEIAKCERFRENKK